MNILIGTLLLGTLVCVIADDPLKEARSIKDPSKLFDSFKSLQKKDVQHFLQFFKRTPVGRVWQPTKQLCFDTQFPWVLLPCEKLPQTKSKTVTNKKYHSKKMIKTRPIKTGDVTKPNTGIVHTTEKPMDVKNEMSKELKESTLTLLNESSDLKEESEVHKRIETSTSSIAMKNESEQSKVSMRLLPDQDSVLVII